jgi:acetyl-CoA carboxylase carboxyl transferase subunit alpha
MLVAQRKGKTTKERMAWNFGSPNPEGYRKAIEKMRLAEKFKLPVVTLVNTPGAYPGIAAEEHGQAFIIAKNLFDMSKLRTPIVSIVIGEGGSGGALGISVADKLAILQNAYLSVISPEGCAAILWRDAGQAKKAAAAFRPDAVHCLELGVVDEIVSEPVGGAHIDPDMAARLLGQALGESLAELEGIPGEDLRRRRRARFRSLGVFA